MGERLLSEWARLSPVILPAIKFGKLTFRQVEEKVLSMKWTLWAGERSAILTEVWVSAFGRRMMIHYAGGDLPELLRMYEVVESAARGVGCSVILMSGLAGWKRVFRSKGFVDENLISKEL